MKKKKIDLQRKLVLSKETVTSLSQNESSQLLGGATQSMKPCGGCPINTIANCPPLTVGSCWCTEPAGTVPCGQTQVGCQTQQLPNGTICATVPNPAATQCVCL